MRTGSGMSVGLWTGCTLPSVSVTSNSTEGIVAISSRSYSRSRRSRTMSMCSSPRKPQRKPKPSASEVSGSQRQRRVVERELLQRVAQLRVVVVVHREQAAEHHRLDVAVAGQRLGGRVGRDRQRVADREAADVLDAGDQVAHLARAELRSAGSWSGVKKPMSSMSASVPLAIARIDLALGEGAVDDADVGDHAAVLVVLGVEDQRARGRVGVAVGRRDAGDDLLQQVLDALAGLGRDAAHLVGQLAHQLGDLLAHALGLGAGEVDLVHRGDQLQAGVDRQVGVGDGLGLDALRGVDQQQRALARGQRARDLVGEVHVPGRVDQVQLVGLAVARLVEHAHGLGLDRDPALALEVHGVQQLRAHRPRVDGVGHLEDAIGQRRLPVVDVGDDREVPDVRLIGHVRSGQVTRRGASGPAAAGCRAAARSGGPRGSAARARRPRRPACPRVRPPPTEITCATSERPSAWSSPHQTP